MKGRRSSQVQLVALGTVLLGACSDHNVPKDRYVYKARPECVQDWGDTNCQPAAGGAGGSGYFYGPHFNAMAETPSGKHVWTGTPSQPAIHPLTGQPMGGKAVNVARGGFGSFARSFSSGGT